MPLRTEAPASWRRRLARALADRRLWRQVETGTTHFVQAKAQAYSELGDVARLRDEAARIRADALARLPELAVQLEEAVRARGGHVHHAADDAAVGRIVLDIARRHGARLAVKSKSMVSEEVGLNDVLAAGGVGAVETDLGEYLVQLAGEPPSHLVAPAMHRTLDDCAELLGLPGVEDVGRLTAHARSVLRARFLAADMGLTGGNFLVAETGTLVLVTNEGNGRMVTSLPPVHVAVVGIEKLVPRLSDLPALLALLPRAATGQKSTAYVSLITGPAGEGEADGPAAFHVVLVDNGRLAMRESPYAAALACVRCAACLNVCPVYRQTGGHGYGSPYSGPVGAIVTSQLGGMERWSHLAWFCSMCGACTEACPVEIPLHRMIRDVRVERVGGGLESARLRWFYRLWAWLWSDPGRYRAFYRLARVLQRVVVRSGPAGPSIRWMPAPLSGWVATRDIPPLADRTFRERWAARAAATSAGPSSGAGGGGA